MALFRRSRDASPDPQSSAAARPGRAAPDWEPTPPRKPLAPIVDTRDFRLTVREVLTGTGRGTAVTGVVESGKVGKGSALQLSRDGEVLRRVHVTAIEKFGSDVDTATVGDDVGLFLRNLPPEELAGGDVLSG